MYEVMLINYDETSINDILNMINWNELGLKVTSVVNNEQEAWEKFICNKLNIIVINNTVLTSQQENFIKQVKKINFKVKIVLLSNCNDLIHIKNIIELGIEDYILKPVNSFELQKVLMKNVIDIKKDISETKSIEKNVTLFEYINENISFDILNKFKEFINVPLDSNKYSVSIIKIINKNKLEFFSLIENIINNILLNQPFDILHNYYEGQVIIVNSWKENITIEEIEKYYNQIKDKIICYLEINVFISIGDLVNNIDEVSISYKVANKLKEYIITEGVNLCISSNTIDKKEENKFIFDKEIEKINKLVIEKDLKNLSIYLDKLFENKKLTPKNIYDLSIKILFLIEGISSEFKLDKKNECDSLTNTIVNLCNRDTRESIKIFIKNKLNKLIDLMSNNIFKYSPVVQQVVSIANERYYEELSLKTLSQKYNVNSSYLGQIFNKEVGVSFSEYLNRIKNTKAKELILNTNMRINDIAKAVGYLDTSYFYRKFKKYFGVCPSTIRNMKKY